MAWLTNKKTGAVFNTDWLNRERQIALNRVEADNLNDSSLSYKKTRIVSGDTVDDIDKRVFNNTRQTIADLNEQYPEVMSFLSSSGCTFKAIPDNRYGIESAVTSISNGQVKISQYVFNTLDPSLDSEEEMIAFCKKRCGSWYMECSPDEYKSYLACHEYGHIVQNYILNRDYDWKKFKTSRQLEDAYTERTHQMAVELIGVAKRHGIKLDDSKLSEYAKKKLTQGVYSDLFAECFANMHCGKSNCWGDAMRLLLKEKKL